MSNYVLVDKSCLQMGLDVLEVLGKQEVRDALKSSCKEYNGDSNPDHTHMMKTAPEMFSMLELAVSLIDGDSIEDFTYQYQEIVNLLAEARGEV